MSRGGWAGTAIACAALVGAFPAIARAQSAKAPAVRIQVDPGFNGFVRPGRMAALRVTLDTGEEAIEGQLEVREPDGDEVTEMPARLPRRAHQQYTLYLTPRVAHELDPQTAWIVSLRSGRRRWIEQRVTARTLSPGAVLLLSVTGDASGLQFLEGARWPLAAGSAEATVVHTAQVSTAEFPRHWAALAAADLVAINGRAWTELDGDQRRALREWVEAGGWPEKDAARSGGRAILCGARPTEWRDADGAALTAMEPSQVLSLARLGSLRSWCGEAFVPPSGGAVLAVTGPPVGEGGPALLTEAGSPLARVRHAGLGETLWVGFDPFGQAFREWEGAARFWQTASRELLSAPPEPRLPPLETVEPARAAARSIPRLSSPPVGLMAGFAVVYALLFGPVNLWLLRRLRRTVRAWLLMPAIAAGMAVLLLAAGESWGSGRAVLNEVTVLETDSGALAARQTTLLGVLTPTNRSFDLVTADVAPLFRPVGALYPPQPVGALEVDPLPWPTRQGEGVARFEGQALQLYSMAGMRVTRAVELGGAVRALWRDDGGLQVTNSSQLVLKHVAVAWEGRQQSSVDLSPGERHVLPDWGWRAPVSPATSTASASEFDGKRELLQATLPGSVDGKSWAWLSAELSEFDSGVRAEGLKPTRRACFLLLRVPGRRP